MVAVSALGHVLLKVGMNSVGEVGPQRLADPLRLAADFVTTPTILVAIPLYVAGFLGWVFVLSRLNLSVAYPALSLMYVLIPLAAWFFLSEPISGLHWTGILIVAGGVVLIMQAGLS